MAIFRVPKISSDARNELTLTASEIVYDVDKGTYYGGDGSSIGGFEIGRNAGLKIKKEQILLTQEDIQSKKVSLEKTPENSENVILIPEGGIEQVFGIDFMINQNELSWDGLGLDGFLEKDEYINVIYFYY